jgi:hypothetical protein
VQGGARPSLPRSGVVPKHPGVAHKGGAAACASVMEEKGLRAQARVVHYIFTPGGAQNRAQKTSPKPRPKDQPGGMWSPPRAPTGSGAPRTGGRRRRRRRGRRTLGARRPTRAPGACRRVPPPPRRSSRTCSPAVRGYAPRVAQARAPRFQGGGEGGWNLYATRMKPPWKALRLSQAMRPPGTSTFGSATDLGLCVSWTRR